MGRHKKNIFIFEKASGALVRYYLADKHFGQVSLKYDKSS